MSLPPQNTAVLCSARLTWLLTVGLWVMQAGLEERRQGQGGAGRARRAQAGPGVLRQGWGTCPGTAL